MALWLYWLQKTEAVCEKVKYEGKSTACRALIGLIAKHLLVSEYLLHLACRFEFSLSSLLSNLTQLLMCFFFSTVWGFCYPLSAILEKVSFSLFSLSSSCNIICTYLVQLAQQLILHRLSSLCSVHYPPWLTH